MAGGLLVVGPILLIVNIVSLILIFKMKAGRNWARLVLSVFSAISIVTSLTGMGTNTTAWFGIVLTLVALVFLWLPASNPHFRKA